MGKLQRMKKMENTDLVFKLAFDIIEAETLEQVLGAFRNEYVEFLVRDGMDRKSAEEQYDSGLRAPANYVTNLNRLIAYLSDYYASEETRDFQLTKAAIERFAKKTGTSYTKDVRDKTNPPSFVDL